MPSTLLLNHDRLSFDGEAEADSSWSGKKIVTSTLMQPLINTAALLPSACSQTLTVWSCDANASSLPLEEKASPLTHSG